MYGELENIKCKILMAKGMHADVWSQQWNKISSLLNLSPYKMDTFYIRVNLYKYHPLSIVYANR